MRLIRMTDQLTYREAKYVIQKEKLYLNRKKFYLSALSTLLLPQTHSSLAISHTLDRLC